MFESTVSEIHAKSIGHRGGRVQLKELHACGATLTRDILTVCTTIRITDDLEIP